MAFLGLWIFLCLMLGMILFFIIGIFFLKREWECSRFEKARDLWDLSVEIISYVKEQNPGLTPNQLKEEVKKILVGLDLVYHNEFLQLLISQQENEKAVR